MSALIVAEDLLVHVAPQVEGLDVNVGAANRPLEQAPKVFEAIGVDVAPNVRLGLVNDAVDVLGTGIPIGLVPCR